MSPQGDLFLGLWVTIGTLVGLATPFLADYLVRRHAEISPLPQGPRNLSRSAAIVVCGTFGGTIVLVLDLVSGSRFETLIKATNLFLLLLIALIDWRAHLVLDIVTYPAAVLVAVLSGVLGGNGFGPVIAGALVGLLLYGLLYGLGWLFTRQEALGFGDVKLAGLIGLMVGVGIVLPALLLAAVIGGVVSILLVLVRRHRGDQYLPYGIFMAAGAAYFVVVG